MLPWCYESRRHGFKLIYLHVLTPKEPTYHKEDIKPSHITKENPWTTYNQWDNIHVKHHIDVICSFLDFETSPMHGNKNPIICQHISLFYWVMSNTYM